MRFHRRLLLIRGGTAALAAALGAAAQPAAAQAAPEQTAPQPPLAGQASPDTSDEGDAAVGTPASQDAAPVAQEGADGDIVVTGIRRSLAEAINTKREAVQIVDSIVAEDIGKLPDRNVAESLQRVSGVQVQRGIGEASGISIRGLRQNNVLLNGRNVPDAGGRGTNGLDSINSGSYGLFSRIPSELLARLDVVKLPAADDIEGAIGGTVDIITRRPLDGPDQLFAGSLQGIYSDRADKFGYRGSVLIAKSFADDSFGVLINGVYAKRRVREDGFESFSGYSPLTCAFNNNPGRIPNRNPACPGTTVPNPQPTGAANFFDANGDGQPAFYITDYRYQVIEDDRESIGATGVVQWRPADNLEIFLDVLYTRLTSERYRTWFALPLAGAGSAYSSAVINENDTLASGVINARLQNNVEFPVNRGGTISGALSAKLEEGPVTLFAEYAYGKAKQRFNQFFLRSQTINNVAVGFDVTTREIPTITLPAGFDATNPALFAFSNVFDSRSSQETEDQAVRVDFDYEIGEDSFIRSLEAGARYATFDVERVAAVQNLGVANIPVISIPGSYRTFSPDNFLGAQGGGGSPASYLVPADRFAGDGTCQTLNPACAPGTLTPNESFVLNEEFMAAYAKANFGFDLNGVEVSGNVGVRYVATDLTSSGTLRLTATNFQAVTYKNTYRDVLPSGIVRANLTDKLVLRGGFAKILARPGSFDIAPTLGLSVANNPPTGSGGNPRLEPFRADQYDLSLEWYYQPGAIISVGLFKKDIESFLSTQVFREFIPGDPREFLITRRTNGEGGSVKGAELLFQVPFTFLPGLLNGFGVTGTYSYTDSETPFVNGRADNEPLPLEGLSKHNVNVIGYYEKGPFGVRVAYNWRDKFLSGIGLGGAGVFFDNYEQLAVTARYDFNDNIGIDLEASNLTDAGLRRYDGVESATRSYANYGRQYSATLRVRF